VGDGLSIYAVDGKKLAVLFIIALDARQKDLEE
jgi:hypothetical protein